MVIDIKVKLEGSVESWDDVQPIVMSFALNEKDSMQPDEKIRSLVAWKLKKDGTPYDIATEIRWNKTGDEAIGFLVTP